MEPKQEFFRRGCSFYINDKKPYTKDLYLYDITCKYKEHKINYKFIGLDDFDEPYYEMAVYSLIKEIFGGEYIDCHTEFKVFGMKFYVSLDVDKQTTCPVCGGKTEDCVYCNNTRYMNLLEIDKTGKYLFSVPVNTSKTTVLQEYLLDSFMDSGSSEKHNVYMAYYSMTPDKEAYSKQSKRFLIKRRINTGENIYFVVVDEQGNRTILNSNEIQI